jgi:hypothetical protein
MVILGIVSRRGVLKLAGVRMLWGLRSGHVENKSLVLMVAIDCRLLGSSRMFEEFVEFAVRHLVAGDFTAGRCRVPAFSEGGVFHTQVQACPEFVAFIPVPGASLRLGEDRIPSNFVSL